MGAARDLMLEDTAASPRTGYAGLHGYSARHSLRACLLQPWRSRRSIRKLAARLSVRGAGVVVPGGEEGAGLSQKLIVFLQFAHPPTHSSVLSFHLVWISEALHARPNIAHTRACPTGPPPIHPAPHPRPQTRSQTPYPTPDTQHHDDTAAYCVNENAYQTTRCSLELYTSATNSEERQPEPTQSVTSHRQIATFRHTSTKHTATSRRLTHGAVT